MHLWLHVWQQSMHVGYTDHGGMVGCAGYAVPIALGPSICVLAGCAALTASMLTASCMPLTFGW